MQSTADIPRLTAQYQDFRKSRVEKVQGIARNNSASYRRKTAPGKYLSYRSVSFRVMDKVANYFIENSFASGQDFSWLFGYDITNEVSSRGRKKVLLMLVADRNGTPIDSFVKLPTGSESCSQVIFVKFKRKQHISNNYPVRSMEILSATSKGEDQRHGHSNILFRPTAGALQR